MSYTHTWDNTYPPGSTSAGLISQTFRNTKVDIAERLQDIFGMPDFTSDPLKTKYVRLGYTGTGTGGYVSITSDDGNARWEAGCYGGTGVKDYIIYDLVNAAARLTIDHTTGVVSIPGRVILTLGYASSYYSSIAVPSGYSTTALIANIGIDGITNGFAVSTDASNNIAYSFFTKTGTNVFNINASGDSTFVGNVTIGNTASTGGYLFQVSQNNASSYGLFIKPGADNLQALSINNAANTQQVIQFYGYGKLVMFQTHSDYVLDISSTFATYTQRISNTASAGSSNGLKIQAGGNSTDRALLISDRTNSTDFFYVRGDGLMFAPLGLSTATIAASGDYTSASGNITLTGGTMTAHHFIKA